MLLLVVVGGYRGIDKKEAFPIEFENALVMNGGVFSTRFELALGDPLKQPPKLFTG